MRVLTASLIGHLIVLAGCASSLSQISTLEKQANEAARAKSHVEAAELFQRAADVRVSQTHPKLIADSQIDTPVEDRDPFRWHKEPQLTYLYAANNYKRINQFDKVNAVYKRCLEKMLPIGGGEICEDAAQEFQAQYPTASGQELLEGRSGRAVARAKGKEEFLAEYRANIRSLNRAIARNKAEASGEDFGAQANLGSALSRLASRPNPGSSQSASTGASVGVDNSVRASAPSNGTASSSSPRATNSATNVSTAQSQPLINPNNGSSYSSSTAGASCSMQGPRSAQTDKCRCETIHKGRFFVRNDSWYCADASGGHIFGCSAGGSSCSIR